MQTNQAAISPDGKTVLQGLGNGHVSVSPPVALQSLFQTLCDAFRCCQMVMIAHSSMQILWSVKVTYDNCVPRVSCTPLQSILRLLRLLLPVLYVTIATVYCIFPVYVVLGRRAVVQFE